MSLIMHTGRRRAVYWLLVVISCGGCGSSEFVTVTGTVTLDGKPLENAFIEFVPKVKGGSTSYGRTDANGNYDLMFSLTQKGAMPGMNIVRITTADVGNEGEANTPERVPTRYNKQSELTADVIDGQKNVFDFALTLDGSKVVQPRINQSS